MAIILGQERKLSDGSTRRGFARRHFLQAFTIVAILSLGAWQWFAQDTEVASISAAPRCSRISPIAPAFNKSLDRIFHDPAFKHDSIKRLAGAIQIRTEIGDVHPAPADDSEYYAEFYKFHAYLETTFPLVYEQLQVEVVDKLGLVYTWAGSDAALKPLLLAAHQDVVPVNRDTWEQWTHPPFDGFYDEETDTLWGRGAIDCKNLLIGTLEAVELLLKDGFKPTRSVLLAFGFDEESSGKYGAGAIAQHLEQRYGKNGIYAIVDEGSGVIPASDSLYFAAPVTGEKGYADFVITVHGRGGHSSVPPEHTNIGIAAKLISLLEDHPSELTFSPKNPVYGVLTCYAEHDNSLPEIVRRAILNAPHDSGAAAQMLEFLATQHLYRDLMRTSQAVDIIHGGVKANALPEEVSFLVNYRIDVTSNVETVLARNVRQIKAVAEKYGYGVVIGDEELSPKTELGYIALEVRSAFPPAPVSPTKGSDVWDLFAGTIQDVYENRVFADRDVEFYVGEALFSGNTDTRHYWNLTENIYRFMAVQQTKEVLSVIHSVNEHLHFADHLSTVGFLYEYIVNTSEHT
ncbi:AaceriAEL132Wp [[Ashbya] aceris (nom. inval.)]|nr:AaceriAEL132Wp [[Ashbya] aceris (nom. inval.)]